MEHHAKRLGCGRYKESVYSRLVLAGEAHFGQRIVVATFGVLDRNTDIESPEGIAWVRVETMSVYTHLLARSIGYVVALWESDG